MKTLKIYKFSKNNEKEADIVIKCHNCKNLLAVKVVRDSFSKKQSASQ